MFIGESQVLLPIVLSHIMLPSANVVADRVHDRLVERRHLISLETLLPKQAIHRSGVNSRKELTSRVGPQVLDGAGDIDRPRSNQRYEHVLVDWKLILAIIKFLEVGAEPVRGPSVDLTDCFAEYPPAQLRSPRPRLIGDHYREPRILRAGPKRRLTEPGMSYDGDAPRINVRVGFEIVQCAAQSPGPRADRAPLIRGRSGLARFVEQRVDAVLEAVVVIRVEVTVIDRRQAITAREDLLHLPLARLGSPGFVRRMVVDNPLLRVGTHPLFRHLDIRVRMHSLVSVEVQSQEHGNWSCSSSRQINENGHFRAVLAG